MDQVEYANFAIQYAKDHPEVYAAYMASKQGEKLISKPTHELPENITVWDNAFKIEFHEPAKFLTGLIDRLKEVASDSVSYNYLAVVQSSGYGKTRSICELSSKGIPLIYVCFRSKGSTGYPPATPMSDIMLKELKAAEDINTAHAAAGQWIRAMMKTYYEMDLFSKPAGLLSKKESEAAFWNKVSDSKKWIVENKISGEKFGLSTSKQKIHIFFDEASSLFNKDKTNYGETNIPFRAVRRALRDNRLYVVGILTDTNSSVVNLAPWKEMGPSARDYNLETHKPFIYIATTDCLRNVNGIPQIEHSEGYDIIRFGRPLWSSYWLAAPDDTDKFDSAVRLAIHKLLGGASAWSQIEDYRLKRTAALALRASDLVKAHMGTLVAIDKERKRLLVTYPFEPVLSEAALEVLSEENSEVEILRELDGAFQSGGILEAGCQGELVARLLVLSAWRRLICHKRCEVRVSFSIRQPVLDFLDELIVKFPRKKCLQLDGFRIGFSHFISLTYKPDKETCKEIWSRRGAIVFKRNQKGADLAIPIIRESDKALGALIFQIKNYNSAKQNRFEETHAVKTLLSLEVMFADDCCADIEKNYLGIFVHLGSAYESESGTNVSNYDNGKLSEECDSGNRLIIHGLKVFKLDDNHESIFKNLLRAWNDPGRLCVTDIERKCLYQLLPSGRWMKKQKQLRGQDQGKKTKAEAVNKRKAILV
ncbi:178_t:CDS:10 [Funneliformis mosseae]|uniref:178_t:CDS:1 n=1 Tax=Funneliformis mosseae TaxID=27381 RepID=A0A9N8VYV3_FUNMO|nr:178_t:CDS:10 [Funneliformis mosseae]